MKLTTEQIQEAYVAVLGRSADVGGLEYWKKQDFDDINQIYSIFVNSTEGQSIYGGKTNSDIIEIIYNNALGRASDVEGKAYWLKHLDNGLDLGTVIHTISTAAIENKEQTQTLINTATELTKIKQIDYAYVIGLSRPASATEISQGLNKDQTVWEYLKDLDKTAELNGNLISVLLEKVKAVGEATGDSQMMTDSLINAIEYPNNPNAEALSNQIMVAAAVSADLMANKDKNILFEQKIADIQGLADIKEQLAKVDSTFNVKDIDVYIKSIVQELPVAPEPTPGDPPVDPKPITPVEYNFIQINEKDISFAPSTGDVTLNYDAQNQTYTFSNGKLTDTLTVEEMAGKTIKDKVIISDFDTFDSLKTQLDANIATVNIELNSLTLNKSFTPNESNKIKVLNLTPTKDVVNVNNQNLTIDGSQDTNLTIGVDSVKKLNVDLGKGNNTIDLKSKIADGLTINTLDGADEISINVDTQATNTSINTGSGADTITVASKDNNVDSVIKINSGEDNDTINITNASVNVKAGGGSDTINITRIEGTQIKFDYSDVNDFIKETDVDTINSFDKNKDKFILNKDYTFSRCEQDGSNVKVIVKDTGNNETTLAIVTNVGTSDITAQQFEAAPV